MELDIDMNTGGTKERLFHTGQVATLGLALKEDMKLHEICHKSFRTDGWWRLNLKKIKINIVASYIIWA